MKCRLSHATSRCQLAQPVLEFGLSQLDEVGQAIMVVESFAVAQVGWLVGWLVRRVRKEAQGGKAEAEVRQTRCGAGREGGRQKRGKIS